MTDILLDDLAQPSLTGSIQFDPGQFRTVLSHFASGVVVITGRDDKGKPVGMTAQSFTSLSLEPPLILVCPARTSTTWPQITGRTFAVNVLAADQREISGLFSRRGADRFAEVAWHSGPYGMPLIEGAIAHIECDLESVHGGGDHLIAVGRVRSLGTSSREPRPLLYFRSNYMVAGPHPADT